MKQWVLAETQQIFRLLLTYIPRFRLVSTDTVFLSMHQPGLPDCSVCHFPLLTGIVSLWGSSQKAAVLTVTLQAQLKLRKAALMCWTLRDQEGLWGSNFTERKTWGNCATRPFFSPHLCEIKDIPFARGQKDVKVSVVRWLISLHRAVCLLLSCRV